MQTLAAIALPIAFMVFAYHRVRRYLHIFQQEEYDSPRFLAWIRDSRTFDKRLTVVLAAIAIPSWTISALIGLGTTVPGPATTLTLIAVAAALLIAACLEPNPEQAAKKKLAMTQRATRILYVALALAAVLAIALALPPLPAPWHPLIWIAAVQSIPLTLVLANLLLAPVEKNIQDGFRKSAEARLATVAPKTIGITGSFGKTSVKHILGHVM